MSQNPTLQSDIDADMDVFFSDHDTGAVINGNVITGFFSSGDSAFMDAAIPYFEAPAGRLTAVRRGDSVEIDSQQYQVVGIDFPAGRIRLTLGRG
jgi:hypothetical protein